MWRSWASHRLLVETTTILLCGRESGCFSGANHICHSIQQCPFLLDIFPREGKICIYTRTCTEVFIEALLIITQTWENPRCSSVGDELNNVTFVLGNTPSNTEKQTICMSNFNKSQGH